jgi:hypothetical protein
MTSLLDIGPLTEEVPVGAARITVYGLTPEGFFYLLQKFPMLQQLIDGGAKEVSMETLREVAPASIAYALAVATTSRAYMTSQQWLDIVNATANVAMNLSAHHQMALFQAALRLTFPEGIRPFIKSVEALADSINRVSGTATAGQGTTVHSLDANGYRQSSESFDGHANRASGGGVTNG